MSRRVKRPYQPDARLPDVGETCLVAGANTDISCDQDRAYSKRIVVGYSPCGNFICLQTEGCWPTVERLKNCWFEEGETK